MSFVTPGASGGQLHLFLNALSRAAMGQRRESETEPLLGAVNERTTEEREAGVDIRNASGASRMDAVSSQISTGERISLFIGIFLVGYAYGLEGQVRSAYQPYATSSFNLHSYLSTINVLRSVVAVVIQPTAAKVADVFGRFEVIVVATLFYVIGMVIESTAVSVYAFCAGGIVYQIGYTAIVLLMEILVADFSSMRARVFFSYVPALPFVINAWLSGTVTSAVLEVTTWRWGIGMWCIIYPIASLPLLITLYTVERRVKHTKSGRQPVSWSISDFLDKLDVVGLAILVAAFSLILAPLTVAGGTASHWKDAKILTPLIIGLLCVPLFLYWEKTQAKTPMVPFHLLQDRGVWAALAVRSLLNFAWYTQGTYLYTVLVVAFDFSIETATRILSFYSFFGVVSGVLVGLIVYRIRRLKHIIVLGTLAFLGTFVLLAYFNGGANDHMRVGIICAQILLGLAGGLFAYPTQASIQASASRDHVAILTGLYLSFYNVGSALGTCLAGAIWTQTLYPALKSQLSFQPDEKLAEFIYNNPFEAIKHFTVGSAVREAMILAYCHVQRLLCVAGLAICIPMIGFALLLRNPRLSNQQVQEEAEESQ